MKPIYEILIVNRNRSEMEEQSVVLRKEGLAVSTFSSEGAALNILGHRAPDVAILDTTGGPINSSLELLQNFRQRTNAMIIVLSDSPSEVDEVVQLRAGADALFVKPCSHQLLAQRIWAALRRKYPEVAKSQETILRGDLELDPERHMFNWKKTAIALTKKEFALVRVLAKRPGVVKSRDQLLDEVYGQDIYVDDRSIDSMIKRIRKKIRTVDPKARPIETMYGLGYRFMAATQHA